MRHMLEERKNHDYVQPFSLRTASRVTNGVNALVFVLVGGQSKVPLSWEQNRTAEGKYVCGLLKSWDDSLPTIHTEG